MRRYTHAPQQPMPEQAPSWLRLRSTCMVTFAFPDYELRVAPTMDDAALGAQRSSSTLRATSVSSDAKSSWT
jgi:hypothetical protein